MKIQTSISNHTVIRVLSMVLAYAFGVWLIYVTREALVLIGIALFLAIALSPPVNFLARKMPRGSRGLATGIAYLVTLSIVGLLAYATIPPLARQSNQLVSNLPKYVDSLQHGDNLIASTVNRYDLVDDIKASQEQITANFSSAGGPILSVVSRISSSLISVITVLVLTFFMLIEGPYWLKRISDLQPKEHRKHRELLAHKMYKVITGYVNGQLLIAFLASVFALIMMTILRVPFAVPLAGIVGLFGLIPLIGATLGAVVVVLVALFTSLKAGIILVVFFIIYQQIENNVIQPVVQARTVEMTPLLIFTSAIIGINLAGILGALLAIPTAACLRVLANDYIDRHHLQNSD
jgi:predicted PurR-regulated permease PerM